MIDLDKGDIYLIVGGAVALLSAIFAVIWNEIASLREFRHKREGEVKSLLLELKHVDEEIQEHKASTRAEIYQHRKYVESALEHQQDLLKVGLKMITHRDYQIGRDKIDSLTKKVS